MMRSSIFTALGFDFEPSPSSNERFQVTAPSYEMSLPGNETIIKLLLLVFFSRFFLGKLPERKFLLPLSKAT